jgi:hypothetical protein
MLLEVPVSLMVLVNPVHFVCRYRDTRHLFDTGLTLSGVNRLLVSTEKGGAWARSDGHPLRLIKSGERNGCVTDESGTRRTRLDST